LHDRKGLWRVKIMPLIPKGSLSAQLEEEDQRGIQLKQVDLETDC